MIFPVWTQPWRTQIEKPFSDPITNFFAQAMYAHFQTDTPFDCFPSLHAAFSIVCFYAWYRYAKINPNKITKSVAIISLILAIGIILSTLFVKQHYIADEIAGILLGWLVSRWMFNKFWKPLESNSTTEPISA
jgi:membrane-associated phospholipid phosphatase